MYGQKTFQERVLGIEKILNLLGSTVLFQNSGTKLPTAQLTLAHSSFSCFYKYI